MVAATSMFASAQSILGSISGTVSDSSGAVLPNATITLHRNETGTDRAVTTDASGNYTAVNLEAGTYDITTTAAGFGTNVGKNVTLSARQQLRYDVNLSAKAGAETVTVNASDVGVIETQSAQISAALTPSEVLDLPANYRGAGSTSPLNVIQTLPGVQPDTTPYPPSPSTHPQPTLKFSLQGGLPSQTEVTVDGISAQNVTNNNIQADAFPSAESISEIRVDGVNNNAEYGQPGEITTVTKGGTNHIHGSAYEYLQNQALDAIPYGTDSANKPHKVANDFGFSIGGPVEIPGYNGHARTFFFGAYEALRYPQSNVLQARVPTTAMKSGNFSAEQTTPLFNPFTGGTYSGNQVPVNTSSAAFLQFYPDPNIGPAGESLNDAIATRGYNYLGLRSDNISSNQADFRGDHNFGSRSTLSGRYTFKNVNQLQPADLALPYSTAYAKYQILATTFTYAVNPHVADEFRFGFTLERDGNSNPFNGPAFLNSTGLNGVSPAFFNGLPNVGFINVTSIGERLGFEERSRVFQFVDNLTWQHGSHLFKFGGDFRHLVAHTEAGGSTVSANYGNFYFNSSAPTSTGNEFADFLIGVPATSQSSNIQSDNNGIARAYAAYAQDTWQARRDLTLNFGLRYEFHPAFTASNGLAGNFDPSVPQTGRLIYPSGYASTLSIQELANVNACVTAGVNNPYANNQPGSNGVACTPVVSSSEAGVPAGLRQASKYHFTPRVAFAYRPFGNDRTAIRGGIGYYTITTSGALFYALTQTLQSNFQSFTNSIQPGGGPAFAFPNTNTNTNTFTPSLGSVYFYAANDVKWHDPYSLQTNLSVDHDFGHNIGARISYVGMHTWHLVWQPQFNQLQKSSTTPSFDPSRAGEIPFPNFYQVTDRSTSAQADYRALELELSHRMSNGLAFDTSYTWAKNLSDNQGTFGAYTFSPSFVDEQGGYSPTDSFNAREDWGNVSATRRHRWLTTAIYQLPFGRGKRFASNMSRAADLFLGGWQLSNILLLQSGPYESAYFPNGYIDPSGTGSGWYLGGAAQRPDVTGNPNSGSHNRNNWFNNSAFSCPGQTGYASVASCTVGVGSAPIGRYGNEGLGTLVGPGTFSLSSGLSKSFLIREGVSLRFESTFTNVLNHTNLADPVLDITSPSFGKITAARGSDFGGNRTGQLSLKLEF